MKRIMDKVSVRERLLDLPDHERKLLWQQSSQDVFYAESAINWLNVVGRLSRRRAEAIFNILIEERILTTTLDSPHGVWCRSRKGLTREDFGLPSRKLIVTIPLKPGYGGAAFGFIARQLAAHLTNVELCPPVFRSKDREVAERLIELADAFEQGIERAIE